MGDNTLMHSISDAHGYLQIGIGKKSCTSPLLWIGIHGGFPIFEYCLAKLMVNNVRLQNSCD